MPETLANDVPSAATAAILVSVAPDAIEARLLPPARGQRVAVRLAVGRDYQPSEGDRVLLTSDGRDAYVIGVLHAAEAPLLRAGGVCASAAGGALEVRDEGGRLVARFCDGALTICAAEGDVEIAAPRGQLRLRSGLDLELEAGRDLSARAPRKVTLGVPDGPELALTPQRTELESPTVSLRAESTHIASARVDAVIGYLATTARRIATSADRVELTADRIVERAQSVLQQVEDLCELQAGRARTTVARVWALRSRRTWLRSEKDTSIEGRKILLG